MRLLSACLLLACLLTSSLLISSPAFAVYKCETGGKTIYSDASCPDGKQVDIAQKVTTTDADATRARQETKKENATLAQLEKERHAREAAEEKQAKIAARNAAAKKSKCETLAQRVKWNVEDAAHAAGKSAEKTRRKAQRATETYDLQCK